MPVYVGLIRAIGPATHARMGMLQLREACARAGLADVASVGNTGNLIFGSEASLVEVRKLVQSAVRSFGLDNEVFLRRPVDMLAVVEANPFPAAAADRPHEVGVCSFHVAPDWAPVLSDYDGPEQLAIVGTHLVVAYPAGLAGSRLQIEKRLGATMTQRNWRVFAGLAERAASFGTTS